MLSYKLNLLETNSVCCMMQLVCRTCSHYHNMANERSKELCMVTFLGSLLSFLPFADGQVQWEFQALPSFNCLSTFSMCYFAAEREK